MKTILSPSEGLWPDKKQVLRPGARRVASSRNKEDSGKNERSKERGSRGEERRKWRQRAERRKEKCKDGNHQSPSSKRTWFGRVHLCSSFPANRTFRRQDTKKTPDTAGC